MGGTAGCLGGLGALAAFIMPWFVFVAAVQAGCRTPLSVQIYQLTGAALAFASTPGAPARLAQATLIAVVGIGIAGLSGVIRPTRPRALLLMALAVAGVALMGAIGGLAASGRVTYDTFASAYYLGLGSGWWFALGALALAVAGGAGLHAAGRPVWRRGWPLGEITLAALGVAGMIAALVGAVVVPLAPYPSLTCARPATGAATVGPDVIYSATPANVNALDATSGAVLWRCQNPLGGIVTAGPPALAGGTLFVESRDGYVYAIRASDSKILWRKDVGGRGLYVTQTPAAAPMVVDGVVYGVNAGGVLFALRASDGASDWARTVSPLARPSPEMALVDGKLVYVANVSGDSRLAAIDASSGQPLWTSPASLIGFYPYPPASFTTVGDMVYSEERQPTTGAFSLVARSLVDGAERWSYGLSAPGESVTGTPFVANGVVYVEMTGRQAVNAPGIITQFVVALRASDGARLWSSSPGGPFVNPNDLSGIAWASDGARVYLAVDWSGGGGDTPGDTIYAFAPEDGQIVWERGMSPLGDAITTKNTLSLVAAGPSLYLLDAERTLSALDAGSGAVRWRVNETAPPPVTNLGTSFAATLTVNPASGALYISGNRLTAVDVASGATRWQSAPETATTPYTGPYWTPLAAPPAFGG